MKKRRVGEYAVETALRQIELEEILLPDFAAAVCARHGGQARGAFQAYRDVSELGERLEVAPGPQPKSRIANGGSPSMARSSASMFWLTS
jgi:hypothetical protein